MSTSQEPNLALFIDFDNVALGARDARQRFDIQIVLQRLLEKGKIIAKKAYADWSHHKEYLTDLHQAGIELIEIPAPKLSGKNSADIRLVVDAMDMCYGKEHLDTYVIVSGDSDFSPLVSKLRENGKSVIGMGLRNSSSHLLIVNCDEFIFYDDLYIERVGRQLDGFSHVPAEKRKLFEFLIATIHGLLRESRGVLYSSLIKDTMKRKQPEFDEHQHGYSNFGDLLEEGMSHGLLEAIRDSRAGGTWVVTALGKGAQLVGGQIPASRARSGERRRGGRGRRSEGTVATAAGVAVATPAIVTPETPSVVADPSAASGPPAPREAAPVAATDLSVRPLPAEGVVEGSRRSRSRRRGRRRENGRPAQAGEGAPGLPDVGNEAVPRAPASTAPTPVVAVRDGDASAAGEAPAAKRGSRRGGRSRARPAGEKTAGDKPVAVPAPAARPTARPGGETAPRPAPRKKAAPRKAPGGEAAAPPRAPRKKTAKKPPTAG
jgi:uncharacterized protein (TIGR00288 family)